MTGRSPTRASLAAMLVAALAGCTQPIAPSPFAEVSIDQLRTDPARWVGRPVEVEGVVDTQAGNDPSLRENCSSDARSIEVQWDRVPGFHPGDIGAKVRVRGVFHKADGIAAPTGPEITEDGAPLANRGTLQNVSIVWRLPSNLPRCRA